MAKQMSADDVAAQVLGLAEAERKSTVEDILVDLREALRTGMIDGDTDTWASGFQSALDVITGNYAAK